MGEENTVIGSYRLESSLDLSVISRGETLSIRAISESGNVLLDGSQSVSVMSGPAFLAVENDEIGGKAILCGGELGTVINCVGPPLAGAQIKMMPELVTIRVGPPGTGASIVLTPESITFKVGEVTMSITPAGIVEDVAEVTRETTAEGHNFTAGEAEFNLGVEGETKEAPVKAEEIEGGASENDTLSQHSVDAVKNEDAAIEMTE